MNPQPPTKDTAWLKMPARPPVPIEGAVTVGRSEKNTVSLQDNDVSRRHFQIHQQDHHEYWLVDMGSRNGTHVNGVRISHPVRLRNRDLIEAGNHSFEFILAVEPETSPTDTGETEPRSTMFPSWLLVSDVEGYSALAEALPPAELAATMDAWLTTCKQVVEAHDGQINKYLGDGFFAYWRDHAKAVHAVAETLRIFQEAQRESSPRFRLVAHYGTIMAGAAGSLHEEGLMGKEVNFVFRMEKLAGALGKALLLSEAAATRLSPLRPTTLVGQHEVKGFSGAHTFFTFKE